MYVWFQVINDGRMILWRKRVNSTRGLDIQISVQLFNVDNLRKLADIDQFLGQTPTPAAPHFSVATEHCAAAEISPAYTPGKHELSLPTAFDDMPEFFVVAENPTLPSKAGHSTICIYAINPIAHCMEVFPQDWFNDGSLDYGYQWITCAVRDPASKRLLVSGIRLGGFVLDETGRGIELRLPATK